MAYNPNIPQPTDIIANSQADILNNFTAINNLININHQTFGASDEGKHKFLQMPEQGSAPTTSVNEAGLYAAIGAVSAATELVFRRESNGTSIAFTECLASAAGWTRLPSGILMQWATVTIAGVSTFIFPIAFTSACYSIQLTCNFVNSSQNSFVNVVSTSITTTQFTAKAWTRSGSADTSVVSYLAIGI